MIPKFKFLCKILVLAVIVSTSVFSQKSSGEIQQDIDSRNAQIQSLREEIREVEDKIIFKQKEAISTTEILLNLENKISLTEKLIHSLNREEQFISGLIYEAELRIVKMETTLEKLKNQLTRRLQHLYINGRPSLLETILLSNNWNNAIYRIKYLDVLAEHEKKLRAELKTTLAELEEERKKLKIELKQKSSLRGEKEKENSNLASDKKKRKKILTRIRQEKTLLEINLSEKEKMVAEMEALIKRLYTDKKSMKKREEELARKRAEQNRATTGNFAKMKGRLPWPVQGRVISKFGKQKNLELKTITENVGIDIKTGAGTVVKPVLDGVVSTITYIRGHGNIIIIDHGGGFSTVYAQVANITVHENEYVQSINPMAKVAAPEKGNIAKLHFEVWGNQQKLNPENWLIKN